MELHREGSVPAACAAGLFGLGKGPTSCKLLNLFFVKYLTPPSLIKLDEINNFYIKDILYPHLVHPRLSLSTFNEIDNNRPPPLIHKK